MTGMIHFVGQKNAIPNVPAASVSSMDRRQLADRARVPVKSGLGATKSEYTHDGRANENHALSSRGEGGVKGNVFDSEYSESTTTMSDVSHMLPSQLVKARYRQRRSGLRLSAQASKCGARQEVKRQVDGGQEGDVTVSHAGILFTSEESRSRDYKDCRLDEMAAGLNDDSYERPPSAPHLASDEERDDIDENSDHESGEASDEDETGNDNADYASYPATTSGRQSDNEHDASQDHRPTSDHALAEKTHSRLEHLDQSTTETVEKQHRLLMQEPDRKYCEDEFARGHLKEVEPTHVMKRKALHQTAIAAGQSYLSANRANSLDHPGVQRSAIHPQSTTKPIIPHPSAANTKSGAVSDGKDREQSRSAIPALPVRPSSKPESNFPVCGGVLDYTVETLYCMKFGDLQSEPFDQDQGMQKSVSADGEGSKLLLAMLDQQVKGSPDEQQRFLASLTTDEWEKAGTWFTEQFTLLVQRMQQSRRERREVAQKIEDEVTQRHLAINEEDESLKGALKDMRRSGDLVLNKGMSKGRQAG